MVQAVSMDSYKDPTTLKRWEGHFHNVMAHLGHIKNAFEAVMYIIYTVFPTVEDFNSWRMENKAQAMEAVSQALQQLNDIKAIYNECQNPDRWQKDIKPVQNGSYGNKMHALATHIKKLLKMVQNNPALEGIQGSVITQLQVILHNSSSHLLVQVPNSNKNGKMQWYLADNDKTWWDGTKEIVNGSVSSYIEWMWSQEWQGKNPILPNQYEFNMVEKKDGSFWVYGSVNGVIELSMSYAKFVNYANQQIAKGIPVLGTQSNTQSPVFLKDGNVTYWDGSKWQTVSRGAYQTWVDGEIAGAYQSVKNDPNHGGYLIMIQQNGPDESSSENDPKYTTGPTSQAFDAISTTFNSQSSEDQSKFKYLQSNMEQYLGIENSTMTQIIKQEENITGFTKQQSS